MVFRVLCSILLLLGISSAHGAEAEEGLLTERYRGIAHDALYDVCFDQENGMAVGVAGTVLETADAGITWTSTAMALPAALLGVDCLGQRPIVVGQGGIIYTKLGGAWQQVESGTQERLMSVSANRQGLAVAVGGFGALLKSVDGGQTWASLSVDWEAVLNDFLEPHLYDVHVTEAGIIILTGEFELIMRSADGGETWETLNKSDSSLFAMYWIDDATGFAVGQNGKVLRTADAGLSWESLDVDTDQNLLDVWADADGSVVVSGIRTLLKSADKGLSWLSVREGDVSVQWYQAVAASGGAERNVVMVGHSGRVVQVN